MTHFVCANSQNWQIQKSKPKRKPTPLNPKPLNQKPLNPKPETLNHKPLNPKP